MITLIHSSKTMRYDQPMSDLGGQPPELLNDSLIIDSVLKLLDLKDLKKLMKISDKLAVSTLRLIQMWGTDQLPVRPAVDGFLGDIYSGLRSADWTTEDRNYANDHLRILSGLYGILRPLDLIQPYRLEMAYQIKVNGTKNLYDFWADKIAKTISSEKAILNLTSEEYSKAILPHIKTAQIITPKFLTTVNKKPTFVAVHAKIARGSMASWVIRNKIESMDKVKDYSDLGYFYSRELSITNNPTFICSEFKGLGLSVRLINT